MMNFTKEFEWYNQVRIELRLVHSKDSRKNRYQVMRLHPRESLTQLLPLEQAIEFCQKDGLNIIKEN